MTIQVSPICRIIAGPNGAEKTTFALKYLPEVARCRAFVNADLIAAGLSPLAPEQHLMAASRLFLSEDGQQSGSAATSPLKPSWPGVAIRGWFSGCGRMDGGSS